MASFHCHNCGNVTDVSNMLQTFDQHHCPRCGLSSNEIDAKMSDELADMMARNMHLGMQPPTHDVSSPPTPQVVPQPTPITYISQHYHHSAHLASASNNEELQASTILQNAGVNTDALLPSQIQLFKNAQSDQRDRLIELWRIAPPSYGNQLVMGQLGNWPQTSMELEEQAARERYMQQEQERLKNLSVLPGRDRGEGAEPYMRHGYDTAMAMEGAAEHDYRPATDPVHNREREWWHLSDDQPVEHQYGMLQQLGMINGYCNAGDRDRMLW